MGGYELQLCECATGHIVQPIAIKFTTEFSLKVFILPRVAELFIHKEKQGGCPLLGANRYTHIYICGDANRQACRDQLRSRPAAAPPWNFLSTMQLPTIFPSLRAQTPSRRRRHMQYVIVAAQDLRANIGHNNECAD